MRISDWSSDVCSSDLTDAFLVQGLLDPASFFGGDLRLDIERARAVIAEKIATPLGCNVEQATLAMEQAWVAKVEHNLQQFTHMDDPTVLAAFGGGGPFVSRKCVVEGKRLSVRVDVGCRRVIKKKNII